MCKRLGADEPDILRPSLAGLMMSFDTGAIAAAEGDLPHRQPDRSAEMVHELTRLVETVGKRAPPTSRP